MDGRARLKRKYRKHAWVALGKASLNVIVGTILITVGCLAFSVLEWYLASLFSHSLNRVALALFISLVRFILVIPIVAGAEYSIYYAFEYDDISLSRLFYFYNKPKRFFKLIGVSVAVIVKLVLVFLIPIVFGGMGIYLLLSYDIITTYRLMIICLMFITAILTFNVSGYFSLRYFLCWKLLFFDENLKISDIIRVSCKIMQGRKTEVFSLIYSFLPLAVFCVLLLPIYFVIPYVVAVFTVYGTMYIKRYKLTNDFSKTTLFRMGDIV